MLTGWCPVAKSGKQELENLSLDFCEGYKVAPLNALALFAHLVHLIIAYVPPFSYSSNFNMGSAIAILSLHFLGSIPELVPAVH